MMLRSHSLASSIPSPSQARSCPRAAIMALEGSVPPSHAEHNALVCSVPTLQRPLLDYQDAYHEPTQHQLYQIQRPSSTNDSISRSFSLPVTRMIGIDVPQNDRHVGPTHTFSPQARIAVAGPKLCKRWRDGVSSIARSTHHTHESKQHHQPSNIPSQLVQITSASYHRSSSNGSSLRTAFVDTDDASKKRRVQIQNDEEMTVGTELERAKTPPVMAFDDSASPFHDSTSALLNPSASGKEISNASLHTHNQTVHRRLSQRQKQIDLGKSSFEYVRYISLVPPHTRDPSLAFSLHPVTPRKLQFCSKRSFDGSIRKWRRLLHAYDTHSVTSTPLATQASEQEAEQCPEASSELASTVDDNPSSNLSMSGASEGESLACSVAEGVLADVSFFMMQGFSDDESAD